MQAKIFLICDMITALFRLHSLKHNINKPFICRLLEVLPGLEIIKTKICIADSQTCRLTDLQTHRLADSASMATR